MPNFIDPFEIGTTITRCIRDAKRECILVSPYIKLWGHLETELDHAKSRGVKVSAYIRKPKYKNEEEDVERIAKEMALHGDQLYVVPNLHAKIYIIDDVVIIGSMNLYDYSQSNSVEFALLIEDDAAVQEIRNFVDKYVKYKAEPIKIQRESRKESISAFCTKCGTQIMIESGQAPICIDCQKKESKHPKTATAGRSRKSSPRTERKSVDKGFCIRCKKEIKLNIERPFCLKCYKEWAEYENPIYTEDHCHDCGKSYKTSMAKPVCITCFKKAN